jgi:hypothetical protein
MRLVIPAYAGMKEVYGTSDFEIEEGYVKRVEIVGDDRSSLRSCLRPSERPVSMGPVSTREM